MPEPVSARPEGYAIGLDILYKNDDFIVINKPAGLVVYSGNDNETVQSTP
ncbi:hypothetical protein [Bartonella apis]|nr:hypothetical protein [Bartonella apis]MCT6825317.1 hypothetical protein [Bartonella apis]MCT6861032.1 hypothetical protein [Bartonella apis]MCT6887861.1 hypothetical protein [Bartonella apis]